MAIFEPLFRALNEAEVRYVVVGGLAVVLHGHPRLTVDVDLVVDLDPEQAAKAIRALESLGLRPRAPVSAMDFAQTRIRESWIRERGMQVFSMFDPSNPLRVVDLFVSHPIPFEELWSRSENFDLPSTTVRVASLVDLVSLKRMAGRPRDLADVEQLEAILRERGGHGDS